MSIPLVMSDPRYEAHLEAREQMFAERAEEVAEAFRGCEHVIVNKPSGAFYYTVMFKPGLLRNDQVLHIDLAIPVDIGRGRQDMNDGGTALSGPVDVVDQERGRRHRDGQWLG